MHERRFRSLGIWRKRGVDLKTALKGKESGGDCGGRIIPIVKKWGSSFPSFAFNVMCSFSEVKCYSKVFIRGS